MLLSSLVPLPRSSAADRLTSVPPPSRFPILTPFPPLTPTARAVLVRKREDAETCCLCLAFTQVRRCLVRAVLRAKNQENKAEQDHDSQGVLATSCVQAGCASTRR